MFFARSSSECTDNVLKGTCLSVLLCICVTVRTHLQQVEILETKENYFVYPFSNVESNQQYKYILIQNVVYCPESSAQQLE